MCWIWTYGFLVFATGFTTVSTQNDIPATRTTPRSLYARQTASESSVPGLPTGLTSCASPRIEGGCFLGTITESFGYITYSGCRTTNTITASGDSTSTSVVSLPDVTSAVRYFRSLGDEPVITSFTTAHDLNIGNWEVIVSKQINTTALLPTDLVYSSYLQQPSTCRIATAADTSRLDYRSVCSVSNGMLTASAMGIKVMCGPLNPCCAHCWFEYDVCQKKEGCNDLFNYYRCVDGYRYNVPFQIGQGEVATLTGVPLDKSGASFEIRQGRSAYVVVNIIAGWCFLWYLI